MRFLDTHDWVTMHQLVVHTGAASYEHGRRTLDSLVTKGLLKREIVRAGAVRWVRA
jgi:hypothetical protein